MKKFKIMKILMIFTMLITISSIAQTGNIAVLSTISDTGEEEVGGANNGDVSLSSSDLEFYYDALQEQVIAVRFTGVNIPKNATIISANIQFTGEEDANDGGSGSSLVVNITGDDADNSKFLDTGLDFDLSGRTPTTNNEDWTLVNWANGSTGANEKTSDIKSIVSEITSRTNWSSGNAMTFVFTGVSGSNGSIRKRAESGQTSDSAPILIVSYVLAVPTPTSEEILANGNWSYFNEKYEPLDIASTKWNEANYDDSSWAWGLAEFGYGDGDEQTDLDDTPQPQAVYFRKEFTIADKSIYQSIDMKAIRDDGMVVYLNGNMIWESNMSAAGINYNTTASDAGNRASESAWYSENIASTLLIDGVNVIAVEVHNKSLPSSDLSFNFELIPSAIAAGATQIIRGPYLQTGTDTGVIVRWRSETQETGTKINYGTDKNNLNMSVSGNPTVYGDQTGDQGYDGWDHEIEISGLTPNTKYYYNLEDDNGIYLAKDEEIYYKSAPVVETEQFVRAWILGDAGTGTQNQANVRDAYYNYVNNTNSPPVAASSNIGQTDMMLFLGDNAYNDGHDYQFQTAFYDVYDEMFKKSVAWSTLGNHESSYNGLTIDPYYNMFTFPTAGEAGGFASGTEAYYSFDYANIHFIVLESLNVDGGTNTFRDAQKAWLTTDIANTNQDWIVTIFHHPPYTKGSHNSDNSGETGIFTMREQFLPILESGGVDLILSGHSHSYERSYFIKGHTGTSDTFSAASHVVGTDAGVLTSGKEDGDGFYERSSGALDDGAVYITAGSSGKVTGTLTSHNAMYASLYQLGSTIMEVEDISAGNGGGQKMHVKFLTDGGTITDYFTLFKPESVTDVLALNNESLEKEDILMYPVPANGFLNIKLANAEVLSAVKFYNTIGAMVKESNTNQINVSNLESGVYLIQIKTDKKTYYKSIIIE